MNKPVIGLTIATFVASAPLMALNYSFQPSPKTDLEDLPHAYYYEWGINWTLPADQQIVSASLSLKNLKDWKKVTGLNQDVLFLQMMDWSGGKPAGVTDLGSVDTGTYKSSVYRGYDKPAGVTEESMKPSNAFTTGIALGAIDAFTHVPGSTAVLTFSDSQLTSLTGYLSDSQVLLGFDPDCHWFNDGVQLDITTRPSDRVPDGGSTVILLGLALIGLHQGRRFARV